MMLLESLSAASSTIFARMTSQYGDVYCRTLFFNAMHSSLERVMSNGLFLGMREQSPRCRVYQNPVVQSYLIRHRIYEKEYLANLRHPPENKSQTPNSLHHHASHS